MQDRVAWVLWVLPGIYPGSEASEQQDTGRPPWNVVLKDLHGVCLWTGAKDRNTSASPLAVAHSNVFGLGHLLKLIQPSEGALLMCWVVKENILLGKLCGLRQRYCRQKVFSFLQTGVCVAGGEDTT